MKLTRVGIDLAKNIFQVHGVNEQGKCVWKRRLKRATWLRVFTETVEVGCEVGMEACGGAHHWARELQARGYEVKLIAPQFVKPYVKGQKDDATDATNFGRGLYFRWFWCGSLTSGGRGSICSQRSSAIIQSRC